MELDLGTPQQRALLAVLLLAGGRQVSMDALVEALWGPEPPRAAVGAVRTYVHRLRRRFEPDGKGKMIETAGDGYVLHLPPAALDLNLFLHWTSQARQAHRAGDSFRESGFLKDALALWTGAPLAGLQGDYAEAQRARLAELHVAAVEERLAADIELGRHVAAAAELQALLASHPMRERLSELLMLALYRGGRQAEALGIFGHARRVLKEELGISPGPSLQEMHRRILQADDSLMKVASPHSAALQPDPTLRPQVQSAELPPRKAVVSHHRSGCRPYPLRCAWRW